MNAQRTVSDKRAAIVSTLESRPWFQNTDESLREALLDLPEDAAGKNDWNGFLEDLANRPDTVGGVTHRKLAKLLRANFGAIVMFEVENAAGGVFTYEYHSWKHGPNSGSKGVVFVRTGDEITHFIVLRGEKFAPAKFCWDTTGGFADIGAEGVFSMPERIELEIKQELGSADIEVSEVYDLGHIMTDAGQTNNTPGVFAAVVDAHNASKVSRTPVNSDVYELEAGAFVFPLVQLTEQVLENGDTFFQTAVLRSIAKGIIPASALAAS
jgi:hypothetical protein